MLLRSIFKAIMLMKQNWDDTGTQVRIQCRYLVHFCDKLRAKILQRLNFIFFNDPDRY